MKAFVVRTPGGLDRLEIAERPDPGQPGPGEIRVAIQATSLNFHDLLVASGRSPAADGRVLMSDGAGTVEAVGAGVTEFAPATGSSPASSRTGRTGRPRRRSATSHRCRATGSTASR